MTTAHIGQRYSSHHEEKVDAVAQAKRRELQVIRAEIEACSRRAEDMCREMLKGRAELDAAVKEYNRRKEELVDRQRAAHSKLALALESRSAAELAREMVRDRAENDLKAQRTAGTVRAYRLDTKWRLLHGRYRGFVVDVLSGDESSAGQLRQLRQPSAGDECVVAAGRRQTPRVSGRRFFTVADKFSVQYRRESLRTSRSLHAIMSCYLKETSDVDGGNRVCSKGITASLGPSRRQRSSQGTAVLDGSKPEQVLDKLRVMQEQCARIAERVRRRTIGYSAATDNPIRNDYYYGGGSSHSSTNGGSQVDKLSEARTKLAAAMEYLQIIRALKDKAVLFVRRERADLRTLLATACDVVFAVGDKPTVQPNDLSYDTVVDIAGRLERACFALFARLDKAAETGGEIASKDVVASCLHAVQMHRADTIRQAQDIAYRVDDFHKATTRLLLATAAPTKSAGAIGRGRC